MSGDDRAGEFGPIYLPALQRIRDLWLELPSLHPLDVYSTVLTAIDQRIETLYSAE